MGFRAGRRSADCLLRNCLQCDKQNDNDWNQGLLFLNPAKTWGQPPYYVTQMVAANRMPRCVEAKVVRSSSAPAALDVTAQVSTLRGTLVLQVANFGDTRQTAKIAISGFAISPSAKVTQISGKLDDVNTAEEPERIKPQEKSPIESNSGKDICTTFLRDRSR